LGDESTSRREVWRNSSGWLLDAFGRIRQSVHDLVDGASAAELVFRADGESNSMAWLLWHLTRIQDDHVAKAAGIEQAWTAGGWADRCGLPYAASATGYGQRPDEVGLLEIEGDVLLGYHDAVHEQTTRFVEGLADADLDRVVDENWDPPVTLGVRLISVIADDLQHVGQAAFIGGLFERAGPSDPPSSP
jgi:hypothetical protein